MTMKNFFKTHGLAFLLTTAVLFSLVLAPAARAQDDKFPTKPVKIIVQYGPGGGVDLTARILAKYAEKHLGRNIVVENRVGGSGVLGVTLVSEAPADGYTLGLIFPFTAVDNRLIDGVKYSGDSFTPICMINFDPVFLVAQKGSPSDVDINKLLEMTKADQLTMAVGAIWTPFDYLKLLIEQRYDAKFLRLPFDGGAGATKALAAGDADVATQYAGEWVSYYKAGEMSGVAVAADTRLENFPDVPTFKEKGLDIPSMGTRRFMAAPAGTPENRLKILEDAFLKALADPELAKEFAAMGMSINPGDSATAKKIFDEESKLMIEIIETAGIKHGDPPR